MKIKTRILIFLIIVTIATLISIFVLSSIILGKAFTAIEDNTVLETARSLDHELDEDVDSLTKTAKDWARWDDTYDFIMGQDAEFIDDNFGDETFDNLEINSILIINNSEIIYNKYYDYKQGVKIESTPEMMKDINQYMKLHRAGANSNGLLMIDGKLMLMTSEVITNSDSTLISNASIIFAKYVYEEDLQESGSHIRGKIHIDTKTIDEFPGAVEIAPGTYKRIKSIYPNRTTDASSKPDDTLNNSFNIWKENDFFLECIVELKDRVGKDVGVIYVDVERENYNIYSKAIQKYLILFLTIALVLNLIFYMTIKKTLLDKIEDIDNQITEIISKDDPSQKIHIVADEEVVNLMNNFNKLRDTLEEQREELTRQNKILETSNINLKKFDELKDNFLSNVSHEIRTPLTSLKSYTQSMLSGAFGSITSEQRKSLKIILESEIELERIVSDLLDVSRFESGKMMTRFEEKDISRIIRDAVKEIGPQLRGIKGKIKVSIDKKNGIIDIDEGRIKQLLRNVLSNACKYHSERQLEISIKTYKKGKYMVMEIEDNGIGISKEELPHLFEKFYQVDAGMKRKAGGSGLGLVIVKQIAEAHHGKVFIKSKFGKGTILYVYLKYNNKNKD